MLDELEALHKRLLRLETIAFDAPPCCGEAAECVVGVWTVVYADMNLQEKRQADESGAFSGMKMRLGGTACVKDMRSAERYVHTEKQATSFIR